MQSISFYIAMRYARARQGSRFLNFITIFSMAGVALGVAALIVVLSVMNGFEQQLKQRILGAVPHLLIENKQNEQQWQPLIAKLEQVEHVTAVTMVNMSSAIIQGPSQVKAVSLQGIDPEQESNASMVAKHMITGDLSLLQSGQYSIIIGRALARELGVYIGAKVRVLSARRSVYTPLGRMPSQRKFTVVGIFELGSEIDSKVALIHRGDAARLLRENSHSVESLRLYLDDAFNASKVAQNILPIVENYSEREEQAKLISWRHTYGELFAAVTMEKNMMWLMLSLIIAVAAFNIVSALVILVTEKQTDIAIFSTLGLTRRRIAHIFIVQGVFNGLLGTVIGLFLGLGMVYFLNDILSLLGVKALANPVDPSAGLPILIKPIQISYLVVATLVVTFLATLYPSFKAGNVNPAEALKHD
ncbi:MAG: lipoprotein-releasing ABC transporter permease subunit [Gammaproteobacteria bacterium]|nr:lipoprotein-releasing ABC transporter permease subunit [Gammaproteobacteria bacterium]